MPTYSDVNIPHLNMAQLCVTRAGKGLGKEISQLVNPIVSTHKVHRNLKILFSLVFNKCDQAYSTLSSEWNASASCKSRPTKSAFDNVRFISRYTDYRDPDQLI